MAKTRNEIHQRIRARQQAAREKRRRVVRYPTELPKAERVLDLIRDEGVRWYAILVSPQKEAAVQEILARKGIITYCPMDFRWRKRNKFAIDKELFNYPMMPGWVFIGLDAGDQQWHQVFKIQVVRSVVGHEGEPIIIPNDDMTEMVSRFRNGVVRPDEERFMRTNKEYKKGDLVRITGGPLRSFEAKVIEIEGPVAKVMFELFGISKPVPVSTELLEPAA